MWGVTFSSVDCTLAAMRKKEDAWNSIMSGGITGALLTWRLGKATMIGSAVVGELSFLYSVFTHLTITRTTKATFSFRRRLTRFDRGCRYYDQSILGRTVQTTWALFFFIRRLIFLFCFRESVFRRSSCSTAETSTAIRERIWRRRRKQWRSISSVRRSSVQLRYG